jgi:hypothetical protein
VVMVVAAAAFVITYLLYNIKLPVTAPADLEHRAAISPAKLFQKIVVRCTRPRKRRVFG